MVLALNGHLHHIHFPEQAAFWAFHYHALHGGHPQECIRAVAYNHSALLTAWEHFDVPFDFPAMCHTSMS